MLNLFQHLLHAFGQKLLRSSLLKILKQVQDDTVLDILLLERLRIP